MPPSIKSTTYEGVVCKLKLVGGNNMVAVFKAAPDAQKLKVKADRVKGLHLELSALKLAVKAAISQVEKEHHELVKSKEQRTEEVTAQAEGFHTLPH